LSGNVNPLLTLRSLALETPGQDDYAFDKDAYRPPQSAEWLIWAKFGVIFQSLILS
jgi:hypothetical protein